MIERITVDSDNGDIFEVSFGSHVAYERTSEDAESEFIPWAELSARVKEVKLWDVWKDSLVSYERFVDMLKTYESLPN